MHGGHWRDLEQLAGHTFGGPLDDETRREVEWRGWIAPAPGGWTLTALGRRELRRDLEHRQTSRRPGSGTPRVA